MHTEQTRDTSQVAGRGPIDTEARRVDVVDDDPEFSGALAWILRSVGYSVRNFAAAPEYLEQVPAATPSAVVVDLLLPGTTGLSLCREIVARQLPCAFIMTSGHADVPSAVETMRLGAVDFLEKPFTRQRLLEVVDDGLRAAARKQQRRQEEEEAERCLEGLSGREREVFNAIAAGLVTKEIARRLGISTRTVDVHRSGIMQKLRLESPIQLGNLLAILERKAVRATRNEAFAPRPCDRGTPLPPISTGLQASSTTASAAG